VTGIGDGVRDIMVSPQHRILIASRVAEWMFGSVEVLVAAKHLLATDGVEVAAEVRTVTDYLILFDHHEIVYADRVPTESLYLGAQAQLSLSAAGRTKILAVFPEVASAGVKATACRPVIGNQRAKNLAQSHAKNHKPFLELQDGAHPHRLPRTRAVRPTGPRCDAANEAAG
jgi:hypothetical protein